MVRYMTDGEKAAVFFCDCCGKRLDKEDPGEAVIPDLEQFIEDVDAGRDRPDQCEFLCRVCHRKAKEQS